MLIASTYAQSLDSSVLNGQVGGSHSVPASITTVRLFWSSYGLFSQPTLGSYARVTLLIQLSKFWNRRHGTRSHSPPLNGSPYAETLNCRAISIWIANQPPGIWTPNLRVRNPMPYPVEPEAVASQAWRCIRISSSASCEWNPPEIRFKKRRGGYVVNRTKPRKAQSWLRQRFSLWMAYRKSLINSESRNFSIALL